MESQSANKVEALPPLPTRKSTPTPQLDIEDVSEADRTAGEDFLEPSTQMTTTLKSPISEQEPSTPAIVYKEPKEGSSESEKGSVTALNTTVYTAETSVSPYATEETTVTAEEGNRSDSESPIKVILVQINKTSGKLIYLYLMIAGNRCENIVYCQQY